MKKQFLLCMGLLSMMVQAQTPCVNNMSGIFPCNGYDLISQIPLSTMNNSVKANDSWGWTDPLDGKEYAIVCLNEATAFIDISDPVNPIYLGLLPGTTNEHTTWRDAKTYENHVFIVSEDVGHGMQVFDLTRLRDVVSPPITFTLDAFYSEVSGAHNIAINEATGYAYIIGDGASFAGGPHFVNIQDPTNPIASGGYADRGETHDAQIVIYDGPDTDYTGQEILFGSNYNEVVILNVTDKSNPILISTIDYNNVNTTHQGWLTEDQRFFFLGDETDETTSGIDTRTIVFDFEDLDNPQFHMEYSGPSGATDHNGYIKGDKFYLANNAAGLRVIDISNVESGVVEEEGYFDSFPSDNLAGFTGSWNVYPFFESGHILVSDRAQGMLLLKPSEVLGMQQESLQNFSLYPNPTNGDLFIESLTETVENIIVTDVSGKQINVVGEVENNGYKLNLSPLSNGIYFVTINRSRTKRIIKQ